MSGTNLFTFAKGLSTTFTSPLDPGMANGAFRTTFNPNLLEVVLSNEEGYDDPTLPDADLTRVMCSGVTVKNPSLKFSDQHQAYRDTYVMSVDIPTDITFTWHEDSLLQIWRFHRNWVARYYDREYDTFVTGKIGKLKRATITVHDHVDGVLTPRFRFIVMGLKPTSIPDLELGWDKDGADYSVTYKYRTIQFLASADGQTWKNQGYM